VITDFQLLEIDDTCYVRLEPDMARLVKPVIDKYIVFSKATCRDETGSYRRLGILIDGTEAASETLKGPVPGLPGEITRIDDCRLVRMPGSTPRFEFWYRGDGRRPPSPYDELIEQAGEDLTPWRIEDFKAGIVHIDPALSESHLPEALNYDRSGVIDFKKGCYTGQEIVARMYYRGTPKRRLGYLTGDGSAALPQRVSYSSGQDDSSFEDGELISSLRDGNGRLHLLAILPAALVIEGGEAFLDGDETRRVKLQSLPYALQ
jgi:folate-binding protein YgfZ